eukprot:7181009-Alexandrium_andersonii.AAC.1
MSASLVGSEMCIRDRFSALYVKVDREWHVRVGRAESSTSAVAQEGPLVRHVLSCMFPARAPQ